MTWTKQRLNNLFFVVGVLACVVMLLTFDVSFVELWEHLCHAGYWLIPIIGVWLIIYAVNAWSWYTIISSKIAGTDEHVGFWRVYRLTITGYALNYATPVGGYAMMHFFAHFWFWFSSIFIYLALAAVGDLPINTAIATLLGIIIVFCLVAFYIFSKGYRNGLVVNVLGWIGHIPGLKGWSRRFRERHADSLQNIDQQIAALHAEDKRAFYVSLVLEYLSRVIQSSEVLFMLLLFGIDNGGGFSGLVITYLHSILIVSFTTLFANLIGFLPMQLGVQEGGFVLSIAALGLSAALGIFVSIICRVREIIWIAIGMLLMRLPDR